MNLNTSLVKIDKVFNLLFKDQFNFIIANVKKEEERLNVLNKEKKTLAKEFRIAEEEYAKMDDFLKEVRKEVEDKREEAAKAEKEVKEAKAQNIEMDRVFF